MDSWLIEGVQLWADGRKVQAQDFSGSKADLGQVLQGAQSGCSALSTRRPKPDDRLPLASNSGSLLVAETYYCR